MSDKELFFDETTNTLYELVYDDDGTERERNVITENFSPKNIFFDIDTGEVSIQLWTLFRNRDVVKTITLDKIQPNSLVELTKFGYPFGDARVRKVVAKWLTEVQNELPIRETTKGLGWKKKDKKQFFQLRKSISSDNSVEVNYNGNLLVDSRGKYDDCIEILDEYVIPYIQVQTIVAFSVSAALASMLDRDLTLILHMKGNSTTGKTTMLMLAASVWGNVKICTNGIIQTWNTTQNATLHDLCGIYGMTFCFDELGVSEADTSSLIYLLANGTEKKRMTDTEPPQTFSVNVCSTGEIPMKTVDGVNGADVRLLEFDIPWTVSKEHSEQLKAALSKCYGHLGREFVNVLMNIPKGKLEVLLSNREAQILSAFEKPFQGLTDRKKRVFQRAIKKIAVVSLTATLLKKKLALNFNAKKIAEFMITKSALLDISDEEYIRFVEAFFNHLEKLSANSKNVEEFEVKGDFLIVEVGKFREIVKNLGYSSRKEVDNFLRQLKAHGFLHCEKGKLYNRRQKDKVKIQFYEFRISKLKEEGIDYENIAN